MSHTISFARFARLAQLTRLTLACVLGLAVISDIALAQASATGKDQDKEYEAAVSQALQEFEFGNYREMFAAMHRAHQLQPNARTLRGMGVASFELKDYVNAVVYLRASLKDTRKPLTDALRSEAEKLLGRAAIYVDTLTLALTPAEAKVTLDGAAPVLDEHGAVLLSIGPHTLDVEFEGYERALSHLQAIGGQAQTLTVTLQHGRASDGATAVQSATEPQAAAPAQASQSVSASGSSLRTLGFVSLGVAAASAIFSGVTLGLRQSAVSTYNSPACAPQRSVKCAGDHERGQTMQTLSLVGAIGAGAFALTGALLLWQAPSDTQTQHAAVSCSVGLAAVGCSGSF